ncbi:unnamed protein product [Dovyalis caffra]|uniref:Uncharacterized protein n=1 Tax=Dovyalis caffra TaxID=77055 RepID=A0AAV1SS18_9ROSI|nr:unnamed protein product [Dovyalis caffra]
MQLLATAYNVIQFGAKPDGKADAAQPFLKAWSAASPSKKKITVQINGTLVAPTDYRALGNSGCWILFIKVNRVSVFGGNLDAEGAAFWACVLLELA